MESVPQKFVFRGLDGFVGFRHGRTCQFTLDRWDDGTVTVEMLHALTMGRAKFEQKQWWEKVKK